MDPHPYGQRDERYVAQQSSSLRGENTVVQISNIRLSDLEKRLGQRPDPYALITVDGVQRKETRVLKKTQNPKWEDVFEFAIHSTAVTVEIEVFHKSWPKPVFLGSFTDRVRDVKNDQVYSLKKNGTSVGKISLRFFEVSRITVVEKSTDSHHGSRIIHIDTDTLPTAASTPQRIISVSNTPPIGGYDGSAGDNANVPLLRLAVQRVTERTATMTASSAALGEAVSSLKRLIEIVDKVSEIHPICQAAWMVVSGLYKALRNHAEQDHAIQELCVSMRDMLSFTHEVKHLRQLDGGLDIIKEMCQAIQDGATLIDEYLNSPYFSRVAKSAISTSMARSIQAQKERFANLNELFDRTVGVRTWMGVQKMSQMVGEMHLDSVSKETRAVIDRLPNVDDLRAGFDWVKKCLKNTRLELLRELFDWTSTTTKDDPRIFWLVGSAGTGKSTIAATLARELNEAQRLGASFFFSRSVSERNSPYNVCTTIARQLLSNVPKLFSSIYSAVKEHPDIGKSAVATQWSVLISATLRETGRLQLPIVIVLDAVDECDDPGDLLSVIAADIVRLPPVFKVFITSRPDSRLGSIFSSMGPAIRRQTLSTTGPTVDRDISIFVTDQMSEIEKTFGLEQGWPGKERKDDLVRRAAGSFIWVATVAKLIKDEDVYNPEGQLKSVLDESYGNFATSADAWDDLDRLYSQVLDQAFTSKATEERLTLFQNVVGAIVTVSNPLRASVLAALIGIKDTMEVNRTVQKLHSVLNVDEGSGDLCITHPSFVDYLTTRSRCTDSRFFIDRTAHHKRLLTRSLQIMDDRLTINICNVDPSQLNIEVQDLEEKISQIPNSLRYACCFWADHLLSASPDQDVYNLVRKFYMEHLLSWLEVLSLTEELDAGFDALMIGQEWLQKHYSHDEELLTLARDSQRFLTEFRMPISLSATHVYYSAVPFAPKSSLVYRMYEPKLKNIIHVVGGNVTWTSCFAVLEGHRSPVHCVAVSPNGKHIVSASEDRTLRLWDVITGSPIGEAFKGHAAVVLAVMFSPDGKRLVSGSEDRTIRLWDVETCSAIGEGHNRHVQSVFSVAFSPNSVYIASGSEDGCLSVWDSTLSGSPIVEARHNDCVYCVAFSPSSDEIVSGSGDGSLRIWMTAKKSDVKKVLRGHTAMVSSVAYSPDGTQIVSGSCDGTLRLWDTTTGAVNRILRGHTNEVWSVAFSPDGLRIVSGSWDATIRLWDAQSYAPVGEALKGHTDRIHSAVFSADGKYVISGSMDRTIRLWDASLGSTRGEVLKRHANLVMFEATGQDGRYLVSCMLDGTIQLRLMDSGVQVRETIELWGHKSFVTSVAFSPDGRHIVSGSTDKSIVLWSLKNGELVAQGHGHKSGIYSVSYSADGKEIVSVSVDGERRSWTGIPLMSSNMEGASEAMVFCDFRNGWMSDMDGRRLCWVPQEHRTRIPDSHEGRVALSGASEQVAIVDISRVRSRE